MLNKPVYVVRHYSYDYHEFENLIGLAATTEIAERMAQNNEHVYDDDITVTDSFVEHVNLGKRGVPHVYIKLMLVVMG